jgi:hypothetical protein
MHAVLMIASVVKGRTGVGGTKGGVIPGKRDDGGLWLFPFLISHEEEEGVSREQLISIYVAASAL